MTITQRPMDLQSALLDLGWHGDLLSADERQHLDVEGYLILSNLIQPELLSALRHAVDAAYQHEGALAGSEFHQEQGARRLSDLVNKDPVFDQVYTNPRVLACIRQVLARPFKLSSLNARDALPGHGLQDLHYDWHQGFDGRFHVCNSIWLLDDMDEENGCTRLVPGSHRIEERIDDLLPDRRRPHKKEVLLQAPAGSVCVFNAHTWHGGTLNRSSDRSRRALHCYFTTREHPQQTDQQAHIKLDTWKRISPAARYLLDVDIEL